MSGVSGVIMAKIEALRWPQTAKQQVVDRKG